jgi:UDP-glucose 4-epimerase
MNALITGGAGFIGSHLSKKLLEDGHIVVVVDNFELGSADNIREMLTSDNFWLYEIDVTNEEKLCEIAETHNIDIIFHLAANSDIQKSAKDPNVDIKNTLKTTISVLECMRKNSIQKLFFASTSAVYGEKTQEILAEDAGELFPISYYGASKLASEAMISAYSYMNDYSSLVFRFPNVIGPQLTHGVIFDFLKKLEKNPSELEILGDGSQSKPYIYIDDLIEGIMMMVKKLNAGVSVYNIGVEASTTVTKIADIICDTLNLGNVKYIYTGGDRGWKGDVPSFKYSMDKIYTEGWKAKYTSDEAVRETVKILIETKGEVR